MSHTVQYKVLRGVNFVDFAIFYSIAEIFFHINSMWCDIKMAADNNKLNNYHSRIACDTWQPLFHQWQTLICNFFYQLQIFSQK